MGRTLSLIGRSIPILTAGESDGIGIPVLMVARCSVGSGYGTGVRDTWSAGGRDRFTPR